MLECSTLARTDKMVLLGHETLDDAIDSARKLKSLGGAARKLLSECVEHSGVNRKSLSATARALETAGFLFIRDDSSLWTADFHLSPSLTGEEALQILDEGIDNIKL